MRYKIFLFLLLGWSYSFAEVTKNKHVYLLMPLKSNHYLDTMVLENLPPVKEQLLSTACWTIVGTYQLEYYNCQEKKIDCTKLNTKYPDQVVSPLAFSAFYKSSGRGRECDQVFNTLHLGGGDSIGALKNIDARGCDFIISDTCYPLSEFAAKNSKIVDLAYHPTEANSTCLECLKNDDSPKNSEQIAALKAIKEFESSEGAIAKKFFVDKRCKGITLDDFPDLHIFPRPRDKSQHTYSEYMSNIKSALKLKVPVTLSGICGEFQGTRCRGFHEVMVTGYRRACSCKIGPDCPDNNDNCRDSLRIMNSYGETWQKNNDDGWVDAETLVLHAGLEDGAKYEDDQTRSGLNIAWLTSQKLRTKK